MRKIAKGKEAEMIADELEEDVDRIESIIHAVQKCGEESSPEEIYAHMKQTAVNE